MPTTLSIPYGEHPDLGRVDPLNPELARGERCGVTCLGCGESLSLKRGRIRRAHFAHISITGADIQECFETAVHARAKDLLAGWRGPVQLPSWHNHRFTVLIKDGGSEVRLPNGRQVDVLWQTDVGEKIAVEVKFSNAKDDDYAKDMAVVRIPAIEVQVNSDDTDINADTLIQRIAKDETNDYILVETYVHWVAGPFEPFVQHQPPSSKLDMIEFAERDMFISAGFTTRDGTWYRKHEGLSVSIISPVHAVDMTDHGHLCCCAMSEPISITDEGVWKLESKGVSLLESPSTLLTYSSKLFANIARLLNQHPRQHYRGRITDRYRKNEKGNWTRRDGSLWITAFRDDFTLWRFVVNSRKWTLWSEAEFNAPNKATDAADALVELLTPGREH